MPTYIFDCGSCSQNEIRQSAEPALRYVKGRDGSVASVECCAACDKMLGEREKKERAENAKKAAKRAAATRSNTIPTE